MGIEVEEKKTYVCDMCKRTSHEEGFNDGNNVGMAKLVMVGNLGQRNAADNSWAGVDIEIEQFICFSCIEQVIEALDRIKVKDHGHG